jgi:hypothetical protein
MTQSPESVKESKRILSDLFASYKKQPIFLTMIQLFLQKTFLPAILEMIENNHNFFIEAAQPIPLDVPRKIKLCEIAVDMTGPFIANHIHFARAYLNLFKLYVDAENHEKAKDLLPKALPIWHR